MAGRYSVLSSAGGNTQNGRLHRRHSTHSLQKIVDERNCWQLKQKHVLQTGRRLISPTKVSLPCSSTHPTNMESSWSGTGVFPWGGGATRPTETNGPPSQLERGSVQNILTDLKQHVEDTEFQPGELVVIEIPIYSLFLKHQKINVHGYEVVAANIKKADHTTRLSPSSFRPVSLRIATIKSHTPTILATTSMSSGIARLLVKMAFFSAGRQAIQTRLSAPFNLFTMNSVIEYGSRVPKTLDAVF